MNRTLEEILNTPVEFKEGMRVFSLNDFQYLEIAHMNYGDIDGYPIRTKIGRSEHLSFTEDGKYHKNRAYRCLLTEQEAYELFPSLKPKVYEYQVVYKCNGTFDFSREFCVSEEEFREIYKNDACVFIELYQPSKRERKS